MEVVEAASAPTPASADRSKPSRLPVDSEEQVRVRKKTLQAVLEQCQRALELLSNDDQNPDHALGEEEDEGEDESPSNSNSPSDVDYETDQLCDLLKSKVESANFLEKLGSIHMSVSRNTSDESSTWDMVTATDLWEDKHNDGEDGPDQDGYVLVRQEDIVDGIACFMAAYLLSLEQTKELTPNQLQDALCKTFSVKKKKGKLRKAWDGSKVIYNVASWSATAIGIYQNPALYRAATVAFWTSCRVISKLF